MMIRIAIVVAPKGQSLDISGPLDVFVEATRQSGGRASYEVTLIAIEAETLIRAAGLSLLAHTSIYAADTPAFDTLLVAGSPDFSHADSYGDFHEWLRRQT